MRKAFSSVWTWVYASLLVVVVFRLAAPAAVLESFYGEKAYAVVSTLLAELFGWWPTSPALLGLVLVIGYAIYLFTVLALRRTRSTATAVVSALVRLATGLALAFLLFWGINYGRPTIPERLGVASAGPRQLLPTDTLIAEYRRAAAAVNALREVVAPGRSVTVPLSASEATTLGALLQSVLSDIGFPTVPLRRLRVLPKGALLRFGTAGVYSPWTGDPHIDGALHPLQQVFTATHEMAHQQGVTDEGDCNLLAYLAGVRSPDIRIRYSAELTYLRYLRAAISKRDRETFEGLSPKLAPRVLLDLREVRAAQDAYPEIAPAARDLIYDSYLKTQGVSEGLSSYGRIIDHVVAARTLRPELFAEGR